jgi:hypothetical protein
LAKVISGEYEPGDEPFRIPLAGHYFETSTGMTFLGWYQFKLFLEHASGISMDALHVLVGFLIFLLSAQLLKRSVESPLPWLALLTLELGNEAYDLHVELWPDPGSQLGEGVKDIMLTMALPTLVLLLARWRPALLRRCAAPEGSQSTTK